VVVYIKADINSSIYCTSGNDTSHNANRISRGLAITWSWRSDIMMKIAK